MDWEEEKPARRIPVSEQKCTRLDSWNSAFTFIFTKAINSVHFGNRLIFQAPQFTSNSPMHNRRQFVFFHNPDNLPCKSLLNGN